MSKLKQASSGQLTLSAFGQGNVVTLDGGKRIRLDDKVDFWPMTQRWKSLTSEAEGDGVSTMLDFLAKERAASGQALLDPPPLPSRRKVRCNYCDGLAQLHTGADVYPHRGDLADKQFWVCWSCDAWVSCHPGGDGQQPMGSLADEALRAARRSAHAAFDPLWQDGEMTRVQAYLWLSKATGIPAESCHIGMMDAAECTRVKQAVAGRAGFDGIGEFHRAKAKPQRVVDQDAQRDTMLQLHPKLLGRLEEAGLSIHHFSDEHKRIADVIDWWPETGTWMEFRERKLRGAGVESMIRAVLKLRAEQQGG